jgi:hypothetical protein
MGSLQRADVKDVEQRLVLVDRIIPPVRELSDTETSTNLI